MLNSSILPTIPQVTGEREALRLRVADLETTVQAQDEHITKMEQAVSHAEWDVSKFVAVQQSRIGELEESLRGESTKRENEVADISNRCVFEFYNNRV